MQRKVCYGCPEGTRLTPEVDVGPGASEPARGGRGGAVARGRRALERRLEFEARSRRCGTPCAWLAKADGRMGRCEGVGREERAMLPTGGRAVVVGAVREGVDRQQGKVRHQAMSEGVAGLSVRTEVRLIRAVAVWRSRPHALGASARSALELGPGHHLLQQVDHRYTLASAAIVVVGCRIIHAFLSQLPVQLAKDVVVRRPLVSGQVPGCGRPLRLGHERGDGGSAGAVRAVQGGC